MRFPDPPKPPTPDRYTQGKKQPACRRLFVSPSSSAPPACVIFVVVFPTSRSRARRSSRSVVPLLAVVRLSDQGSSQREEAEWARPGGGSFSDFWFVREIPSARARLRPERGAHFAIQKSPSGRAFAFRRAPPGIPAFLRSLSCLHAGSLRVQSPSRLFDFRPVPEREGGSRRKKLAPTDIEWGPQKSGLVTPSEGGDPPGPCFFFSLSSPLCFRPRFDSGGRARAEVDAAQGGSLSIGLIWGICGRLGIWTGQTMMEILATLQTAVRTPPSSLPCRRSSGLVSVPLYPLSFSNGVLPLSRR